MRQLSAEEIRALRESPCMRVREAEQVYRFNRNKIYAWMRDGTLSFVTVGDVQMPRTESLERIAREGAK
jgi:hypothetical protein